mmetsp:Transcript_65655/g.142488  ORF Transcript_65655/g.142488 Transcript_65655/m.142488 type:complete len:263 (-) Transcript_65655:262-1050(-)
MKLAPSDELGQHVHALRRFECFDQVHNERMVVLCEQLTLAFDLLWDLSSLLLHPLECIPCLGAFVLHKPNHAGRTSPDDFDVLKILHGDAGVLELDSFHQVLLHFSFHDRRKDIFLDGPNVCFCGRNLYRSASRLLEQQGSLAEVGVAAHCSNDLSTNGDLHLSLCDDAEVRSHLTLLEHHVALLVLFRAKRFRQKVRLFVGEVSKDVHLFDHHQLSREVDGHVLIGMRVLRGQSQGLQSLLTRSSFVREALVGPLEYRAAP